MAFPTLPRVYGVPFGRIDTYIVRVPVGKYYRFPTGTDVLFYSTPVINANGIYITKAVIKLNRVYLGIIVFFANI